MEDWLKKWGRLLRILIISVAVIYLGFTQPGLAKQLDYIITTSATAGLVGIVAIALCLDAARETYLLKGKQRGAASKPQAQLRKRKGG